MIKFEVNRTSVKNYSLKLVWKTCTANNDNNSGFCWSSWPLSEKKRKLKDSPRLRTGMKTEEKIMKDVGDGHTNCSWCTWEVSQKLKRRLEQLEIRKKNQLIQPKQHFKDRLAYFEESWRPEEYGSHLIISVRSPSDTDVKNSPEVK